MYEVNPVPAVIVVVPSAASRPKVNCSNPAMTPAVIIAGRSIVVPIAL